MYDGTLATNGPWEALVTFQQLLVLANDNGEVDMTPSAIARVTTIPKEIIERGIEALCAPDPESRTPDEEGRRIVLLSEHRGWGWKIVNYLKYRAIQKEAERREYHRNYYHQKRKASTISTVTQQISTHSTASTDTEAEEEADVLVPTVLVETKVSDPCPYQEIISLYHSKCPSLSKVRLMTEKRKRAVRSRWSAVLKDHDRNAPDALNFFGWYFDTTERSNFLTGRSSGHGGHVWRADFEWLMNESNMTKVIEGKYL